MLKAFRVPVCMFLGAALVFCGLVPCVSASPSNMTMMNSVDAAMAYNPEIKARQESRQVSEHAVTRAKAGHMPKVNLYGGAGYSRLSDSTSREYDEDHSFRRVADAGMRLSQPLFHGFGVTYDVDARKSELDMAQKNLEDRAAAIAFDAIVAHTDVLRRRSLATLAERNVKEHADILATVENRYKTGVATVGELNQIRSRHSRALATLYSYQAALDAAIANYQRVVGKTPGALSPAPVPGRALGSVAEVRDLAIQHHPRLQASLSELKAAQSEKGQAKSRFYPFFDIVAGPTWTNRDSEASLRVTEFVGEVRMNWEIFSGGADDATLKMAGARIRQARHNLNSLMNSISEDIESTYSRYLSAAKELREYAEACSASRLARNDYYRQFLSAQRSLLDVLDAENDYFYAASQEVLSRSDRMIASYRLLALGGVLLTDLKLDPQTLQISTPTTSEKTPNMKSDFDSPLSRSWVQGMDYDAPVGSAPYGGTPPRRTAR